MKDNDTAIFSPCQRYRYWLRREWPIPPDLFMGKYHKPVVKQVCFIGLNPSTADAKQNDPTINRCIAFAKSWGYSSLVMVNLFAMRSPNPKDLFSADDPIGGPRTDELIQEAVQASDVAVAMWGTEGSFMGRGMAVSRQYPQLECLDISLGGHPKHLLYLPKWFEPYPFQGYQGD